MAKLQQLARSVWLGSLALAGCGHVARNESLAASAGATAVGVAGSSGVTPMGGTGGGAATPRESVLCENEFVVEPGPAAEVELGFVGTYDGEPTELRTVGDVPSVPTFSVLRTGQHLEAVNLSFTMTATPGAVVVGVNVANCELWGQLVRPNGDGFIPLTLATGWLRSTTVTPDWHRGMATGSLHLELVDENATEHHVLDGTFVWPAIMPDLRMP